MAFDQKQLANMGYGNGASIWHYKTADIATVVDSVGYFNLAKDRLNVGDFIFAHVDTGGTPGFGIFAVTQNDGVNVDVADMTNLAAADTD